MVLECQSVTKDVGHGLCPMTPKKDWSGAWIWVPESLGYQWRNSHAFFRKSFVASGKVSIDIAADTRYELHVDGKRVDRGTAPSAAAYKTFDTHSVTLETGEHTIAVLVHHIGEICATAHKSRPGLLVEITLPSGARIGSDSSWKTLPAIAYKQDLSSMMSHYGFCEVCDFRLIPAFWNDSRCDESDWRNAEVIGNVGCEPWLLLVPRDIPRLKATVLEARNVWSGGIFELGRSEPDLSSSIAREMCARTRATDGHMLAEFPVRLGDEQNNFVVVDFGREVTGHVRLKLEDIKDGQQVDIGYDEMLDEQGLPNPRRTYVEFADRFFLRHGQRVAEVFDGRGFRYLIIDVPAGNGGLVLTGVEVDERTYPVSIEGSFHCNDETLERLHTVGLKTTRLCMLDTYVDCPSRERVMWMDSYLEGLCSTYGMGITDLWRRVLYIFAQDTIPCGELAGAVKPFAPTDQDHVIQSYIMYYVCSLADYVLHSGDTATAEALFDTAMNQFRVLQRFITPEGMLNDKWPSWQFIDWSAMDYGGVSASANAIYLVMLRKGARLARELGKGNIEDDLLYRYEKLIPVYRKSFWSDAEGLFIDAINNGKPSEVRSQVTNVLAIWAGVVEGEEARAIIRRITDKSTLLPITPGDYRLSPDFKCMAGGIVPIGTPGMGCLLARVMFEIGMTEEAIAYLKDAWLLIADNGTFAEHYLCDKNTSLCHGWSAGPVLLLARYVLGVRPLTPGWSTVEIAPRTGSLKWAEGSIPTPLGEIRVSWKNFDGVPQLETEVPPGMVVSRKP